MKRKNYGKMLDDINIIVESDWCAEISEGHIDLHKVGEEATYKPFTHAESVQMAKALGHIYSIAHGKHCVCGNKYRV